MRQDKAKERRRVTREKRGEEYEKRKRGDSKREKQETDVTAAEI